MENLRIVSESVVSSSNIEVTFTHKLSKNLTVDNVLLKSNSNNYPDAEVLGVSVFGNVLNIVSQPLTELGLYSLVVRSVSGHPFQSLNADAIVSEDGTNEIFINGPFSAENPVQNFFNSYYKDNIYDHEDSSTLISKYIKSLVVNMSKALYDIRAVKNENYLSFSVTDEQKVRGSGPFDRLDEECAYEILRVGLTPTGSLLSSSFVFQNFPSSPVTLQRSIAPEVLHTSYEDKIGYLNLDNFVLNLSNNPITKVNKIIFTLTTANPIYVYDISKFGYQLKNPKYDHDYGFRYDLLLHNQIKINKDILNDLNFDVSSIFKIDVEYEFKDLGVVVNDDSLQVYTTLNSTRESLPPIINIFQLSHAPIVDSSGKLLEINGVNFIDPNNSAPNAKHPAFVVEMPFRLNALPFSPGQYSIDYATGTVYVYGQDLKNDGTGPYPPLATYLYNFNYKIDLDYAYDSDQRDLVAIPTGSLLNFDATVKFNYENVLVPGVDYKANLHNEVLSERIGNKLFAANLIKVNNSPITNVFKILNETSGEIYTLSRWSEDKVYFKYLNPPSVKSLTKERATFKVISNENLAVYSTLINGSSVRIFKILLNNNSIISSTEDSIANFTNTSLSFLKNTIFITEKCFNRTTSEFLNINSLNVTGQYSVDYFNGVVYCAVSVSQDFNIGTCTYKSNSIAIQYPHIITPDDIYCQINSLEKKDKEFNYSSFSDGEVTPEKLPLSDELALNSVDAAIYQNYLNKVGIFSSSTFIPGVTDKINFVRGLFEYNDFTLSSNPINFSSTSTSDNFNISLQPIVKDVYETVKFDGYNFYVLLNENIPYISSGITYTFSIVRQSDSAQLWDNSATLVPGNPLKIVLSGVNSPVLGNNVLISYSFAIKNLSRLVVDYNRGDLFIDYTYLADEIVVSYEYGDNVLDFRQSKKVNENTTYYATYKVGALRDALSKNFTNLLNIPEITNFDVDFDRERYRDVLTAALSSFIKGPTIAAIKNIGKTITHIQPEISESVFEGWSLGNSLLNPEPIKTTGSFQLLPGKFNNGVLINQPDQTIKFPINSNLRLEDGTFESWIIPQWNGVDNDANLSFQITKDGYAIIDTDVFVGANEFHPTVVDGKFSLNKNSAIFGTPNKNKDGIFIYYDKDGYSNFNKWTFEVIDGYVFPTASTYKVKIVSDGKFYDVDTLDGYNSVNLTTGVNSVSMNIVGGAALDKGIRFFSDKEHYLLDFGNSPAKNRVSLYKDVSGYLNFKVYDNQSNYYIVSADVSSWKAGDPHFIAASWKLNSKNSKDEIHLFVDGFEVPNIIRYGENVKPSLHESFRTVNPEEIVGLSSKDIVGSTDLVTTAGSNIVSSLINFGALNISISDTIFIDEAGFNPSGYTISSIAGQSLVLSSAMPVTVSAAKFSINRTVFSIGTNAEVFPNIAISTINPFISGNDMAGSVGSAVIQSTVTNFGTQNVLPGYLVRVVYAGLETTYIIKSVSGNNLTLNSTLNVNFTNKPFYIYKNIEKEIHGKKALRPSYSLSHTLTSSINLTISNNVNANALILIRTLGVNNRKTKGKYYVWSNNVENTIITKLPAPIFLDEVKIKKVIIPSIAVSSLNSSIVSGSFVHTDSSSSQPTNSTVGRYLTATIGGTNVNFTTPTQVVINGTVGMSTISETLSFSAYGHKNSVNAFKTINYITVTSKPININKSVCLFDVKETNVITVSDSSGKVPAIKLSYLIDSGLAMQSNGVGFVKDTSKIFSDSYVGEYLVIQSPGPAAGTYKIVAVSSDRHQLQIISTNIAYPLPSGSFVNGVYQILRTTNDGSGLQNGLFTFEKYDAPGQAYLLSKGFYEFEYSSYAKIKLDPLNDYAYFGSDFNGNNQVNAIVDQLKLYSSMITDTRVGETVPSTQMSVTKDFNSLKPLSKDINTLMLVNFDSYPFKNSASFYKRFDDKNHFQSTISVNENFGSSIVILDKPVIIDNAGILDTRKESTIEFWVNSIYDGYIDPTTRYYFDAYGSVTEEVTSVNSSSVRISNPSSKIISVKLKSAINSIDYFAGGSLDIDSQNAYQEQVTSSSNSSVVASKNILQVISVKILNDFTEKDYFIGGSVNPDGKTIYLGTLLPSGSLQLIVTYQTTENNNLHLNNQIIRLNKQLPSQNCKVIVTYLPKSIQGDRISIYKDPLGFINFGISASGKDYLVKTATNWSKGTWHRVKASYIVNSRSRDDIRLFVDGYESGEFISGTNLLSGMGLPSIIKSYSISDGYGVSETINFKDSINELTIGNSHYGVNPAFCLLDNLRISNVFRPVYAPYGEALDVNYSHNLDLAFPVTNDLYTTYLMDFSTMVVLNQDFSTIRNRQTGQFDFGINIFDEFGVMGEDVKVKGALEKLIKVLKPANSKVFISYL